MLQFFAEELTRCQKIRLIYMGMLLLPSRTMGEYGIEENGVIHSVITDARKCVCARMMALGTFWCFVRGILWRCVRYDGETQHQSLTCRQCRLQVS